MLSSFWLPLVLMTILLWSGTSLLYKAGVHDGKEEHLCLKCSVCIGMVFFPIALCYLIIRDEPFTIWESAVRYWPVTLFGIIYSITTTISFKGYVYNEVTVESPVENIAGVASTVLLILAYLVLGRVNSVLELLTPLRTSGILLILVCMVLLSTVRNRENAQKQKAKWMRMGLGTLIFPVLFATVDGLETIVTGVCLDTTYGFGMPEGDSIIIVGMEYALFALAFWIYIYLKEKKPYDPFTRHSAPRILGALADNTGIVFYAYAMAINSVSTDPLLALYPIFTMIGGRIFMKEKLSLQQYICLSGVVVGSFIVIIDTIR